MNGSREIYEANKEKGFHEDGEYSNDRIATMLMLTVSELSEALEALRKGHVLNGETCPAVKMSMTLEEWSVRFEENVKNTFEDEIADTMIRLLDLCGKLEINIADHVYYKLMYNKTRAYKHGKKILI